MLGDFLHKPLTFDPALTTRKGCLVVRTMMTAAAAAPALWSVQARGGRCVCLFPCSLGGGCRIPPAAGLPFPAWRRCRARIGRAARSVQPRPMVFRYRALRKKCGFARAARACVPLRGRRRRRARPEVSVPAPRSMLPNGVFFVPAGGSACVACPERNGYSGGMLRTFNPAAASRLSYDHS